MPITYHFATFAPFAAAERVHDLLRDRAWWAAQIIFVFNFFYSMFFGPKAGRNPWHANGLEWSAPSPPGHGNFDFQPIVYRGPYEYGSPESTEDYYPQMPAAGRGPAADRRFGHGH